MATATIIARVRPSDRRFQGFAQSAAEMTNGSGRLVDLGHENPQGITRPNTTQRDQSSGWQRQRRRSPHPLFGLVGKVVRINTNAMAPNQTGREFQKTPLGPPAASRTALVSSPMQLKMSASSLRYQTRPRAAGQPFPGRRYQLFYLLTFDVNHFSQILVAQGHAHTIKVMPACLEAPTSNVITLSHPAAVAVRSMRQSAKSAELAP